MLIVLGMVIRNDVTSNIFPRKLPFYKLRNLGVFLALHHIKIKFLPEENFPFIGDVICRKNIFENMEKNF